MSEIIAHYVKDRETIQIYDSASGSGSLLLNIGQSIAKHIADKDNIKAAKLLSDFLPRGSIELKKAS